MNNKLAAVSKSAKYSIALLFTLLTLFNSCKDNTGDLGSNVLPQSDILSAHQTDTTTIITSMFLKDSALTSTGATNSVLGSYNDPVFGETKASIYAEVSPSTYPGIPWAVSSGPDGAQVDSTVLLLPLLSAPYGNSEPQNFAVYRTDSNLVDTAYYSNKTFKLQSLTPIGSGQVNITEAYKTDTLRIKLSKSFQTYFINQVQFGGQPVDGIPPNWNTNFNNVTSGVIQGIYITPENPLQLPGQGAYIYPNLSNSFAGIFVYYHYTAATRDADSAYWINFPIGGSGPYFTHIDHNYATLPLSYQPTGIRDSVPAGQFIYVQSLGGALGRINFPNLYKNWSKFGPIVVNEAVLNLPIDAQETSANFGPPLSLNLLGTSSTWGIYGLPDGANTTFNGNSYSFVITKYIQSIIDGKNDSDRGLYIYPQNYDIAGGDLVLYGAQHSKTPANRASLTIYYTKLKNP